MAVAQSTSGWLRLDPVVGGRATRGTPVLPDGPPDRQVDQRADENGQEDDHQDPDQLVPGPVHRVVGDGDRVHQRVHQQPDGQEGERESQQQRHHAPLRFSACRSASRRMGSYPPIRLAMAALTRGETANDTSDSWERNPATTTSGLSRSMARITAAATFTGVVSVPPAIRTPGRWWRANRPAPVT